MNAECTNTQYHLHTRWMARCKRGLKNLICKMAAWGRPALLAGLAGLVLVPAARAAANDNDAYARGFIVKLKASAVAAAETKAVSQGGRARAQAVSNRVAAMAVRARVSPLNRPSALDRTHLLGYDRWMTAAEARTVASRLRTDPDVEWVVPNFLKRRMNVTLPINDDFYANTGDVDHQWYLRSRSHALGFSGVAQPAAPDIEGAWSELLSWAPGHGGLKAPIVVAVLDSGVRFDHPDLNGQTLPGYDFVSDYVYAGDGNGLDNDPSDPGDFVSTQDRSMYPDRFNVPGQPACDDTSAWHGTLLTGMLAAVTDNSIGVAGMLWPLQEANASQPVLLPVRVAGKCGAMDSDIIEGMFWAAGISYSGSPPLNPHPARVLSLSYGGDNTCNAAYQDAVSRLANIGVLLVAAAGNGSDPNAGATDATEPANCSGVLAVTAVRRDGSKAAYANLIRSGSGIATVGGDYDGGSVREWIWSTSNAGTQQPSGYPGGVDDYSGRIGTSFSTPIVAGVAAMMLSVQPALTPSQVIAGMTASKISFPTVGGASACTVADTGHCNCDTTTCGAGILDAVGAVQWAETASPNGGLQTLLGANTAVAAGSTSSSWTPARGHNGPSGGGAVQPGWLLGVAMAALVLARVQRRRA